MKATLMREPLFHFALLGAFLFGINALFAKEDAERDEIVVSQDRVDHLAAVFERGWQRPPTGEELQGLIENYIREEVLYREALKLELDRDDTVIRRRLRMKMEFLAKDLIDAVEPGEKALKSYFANKAQDYLRPAQFSFRQFYFDSQVRQSAADDARAALAALNGGAPADDVGDSNLLPQRLSQESAGRVDRLFGAGFAAQLSELPQGRWAGPVESAYGLHLVFVETYEPQRPADFAAVRPQVLRDWQAEEKKRILQTQYDTYRSAYKVRIEGEARISTGEVALK
ncbi:peptidylprolyl isomerase [Microbulbifer magnicolonia]|uniref:peptidylprolyl isomerase n=1 Tax=Microbulbifer magnicolonia TaxID=3109744 RepID=UPI002B40B867|nr:peptidylprolyl isomerase [Microbulbifer sp. GG15]